MKIDSIGTFSLEANKTKKKSNFVQKGHKQWKSQDGAISVILWFRKDNLVSLAKYLIIENDRFLFIFRFRLKEADKNNIHKKCFNITEHNIQLKTTKSFCILRLPACSSEQPNKRENSKNHEEKWGQTRLGFRPQPSEALETSNNYN